MDDFDRRDPDVDVPTLQDLFRLIRCGLLPTLHLSVYGAAPSSDDLAWEALHHKVAAQQGTPMATQLQTDGRDELPV